MDVSTNSIKGKKYRFTSSSRCFKSLQEFLYTGQIMRAPPPPLSTRTPTHPCTYSCRVVPAPTASRHTR